MVFKKKTQKGGRKEGRKGEREKQLKSGFWKTKCIYSLRWETDMKELENEFYSLPTTLTVW